MIRITGVMKNGREFLLLGVDRTNINRLTNGEPIICRMESVNIDRDVMLVFGETLEDVAAQLVSYGIVTPKNP